MFSKFLLITIFKKIIRRLKKLIFRSSQKLIFNHVLWLKIKFENEPQYEGSGSELSFIYYFPSCMYVRSYIDCSACGKTKRKSGN